MQKKNRKYLLLVVLAVVTFMWLWRRRGSQYPPHKVYPEPDSLIRPLTTPINVLRTGVDELTIRWQGTVKPIKVVGRTFTTDTAGRVLADEEALSGKHAIMFDTLPTDQRTYFDLYLSDGRILTTAERILPLQNGINFRDIGGYETADGHFTNWGKLYRSGDLSQLTDADLHYLENIRLKLVCDLRTADEGAKSVNRLPNDPDLIYQHAPIYENPDRSLSWILTLLLRKNQIEKLWQDDIYIKRFVEDRATAFGRVLTLMADEDNYPMVVHCTAGKDRTGISFALLLEILGVPDETIIADYTLSNKYYPQILAAIEGEVDRLAVFGLDTPDLFPLLTAHEQVIRQTLAHIRQTYGSVESYLLTRAGVTPAVLGRLRENLLTH